MKIQRLNSKLILVVILLTFPISLATYKFTKIEKDKITFKHSNLVSYISKTYNITYNSAKEIVIIAKENSYKNSFPQLHDTLAIIGIESSYKEKAISKCKAKGLMQVLYKKTSFDPKLNILHGTELLKEYAARLPNKDAVIQSYNVGITNFKNGIRNQEYLNKFKQEKEKIKNADNVW